jgi:hypothetical protein
MKKQFVIGLIFLKIVSAFIGCFEENNNDDLSNEIKLLNYNVETWESNKKLGDGFINSPNISRYYIDGRIQNNLGYEAKYIVIKANFIDKNGDFLDSYSITLHDVPNEYDKDFTMTVFYNSLENYENISSVYFDLFESDYPQ